MNVLGRDIKQGEVVVLRKDILKPEYHALDQRLVKVYGGFGRFQATAGRALYVEFLSDHETSTYDGWDIDPQETAKYQKEHPEAIPAVNLDQ